jgi:hypothetical protein
MPEKAVGIIPCVTVEIPAIPESGTDAAFVENTAG